MKRQHENVNTDASATDGQDTNKRARTKGLSEAASPAECGSIVQLPPEILSLIANGTDARGQALLDPRHRFFLRQVCRAFYNCVSSPSAADAARLRTLGQTDDACRSGRAASLALVVEKTRSQGFTVDEAVASYDVPTDARRGWITAWIASAPVDSIMADFARMAASLLPACPDWFPLASAWPLSWDCWEPDSKSITPCDIARRNLVCTACCVGRLDVVDALMGWFGIADISTLCPAVHAATRRGQVATVATLFCYAKQRLSLQIGSHTSTMRLLFNTAGAAAAARGADRKIMYHLVGWCCREHNRTGEATEVLVGTDERHVGFRPAILDDLALAERVRSVACNDVNLDPYWVSTGRLDVLSQVINKSRFDGPSVLLMAVVSGSLGMEIALASRWDEPGFVLSDLPLLLYNAFKRVKESVGVPTREAFARGMERLRDRFDIPCDCMLYLADALNGHLDLAAVVLRLWPPVPTAKWSRILKGRLVYCAINQGHWGVLGKIIRAYGRVDDAPDGALSQSRTSYDNDSSTDSDNDSSSDSKDEDEDADDFLFDDHDNDDKCDWTRPTVCGRRQRHWWRKVADAVSFVRRANGSLTVCTEKAKRSLAALSLLCQMAYVTSRITPDAASRSADAHLFARIPEDDREIDINDWSRWCGDISILPRRAYQLAETIDLGGTNEKQDLVGRCDHLITLLDSAGLVRRIPAS